MNLEMRDAEITDSKRILSWRNHKKSLAYSKNSTKILEVDHKVWFTKRLESKMSQPFWIFLKDSKSVGYVRLEISHEFDNAFDISIGVNPKFQNKGFGRAILFNSLEKFFNLFPTKKIIARVNKQNQASISLFEGAEFHKVKEEKEYIFFERAKEPLRFIFRADASIQDGAGHVLRAFGIIEELIARKYKVFFIGKIINLDWLLKKVQSAGFEKILQMENEFHPNKISDILILDSYRHNLDSDFIDDNNWRSVVLIFDEYTPRYKADLGVHLGIRTDWNLDNLSHIISGPRYFPIRKNILKRTDRSKNKNLVITVVGGGSDSKNFVPEMAKILSKTPGDFLVNFFTNERMQILADKRFKIFEIGESLDLVGNITDLAFSTASTTALEFIARGCAVGISCSAKNQVPYYDQLNRMGLAKQIGFFNGIKWELDYQMIKKMIDSKDLRNVLAKRTLNFSDLNGAKRIVNQIIPTRSQPQ